MKCKKIASKLNNFVVQTFSKLKINDQSNATTAMPAMPKEKSSALAENNFSELVMKENIKQGAKPDINSSCTMDDNGIGTGSPSNGGDQQQQQTTNETTTSPAPMEQRLTERTENNILTPRTQQTSTQTTAPPRTSTPGRTPASSRTSTPGRTPAQQAAPVQAPTQGQTPATVHTTTPTTYRTTTVPSRNGPSSSTQTKTRTPNDFRFGKAIGEGSFSTVYLAEDIHSKREYAIKVCEKQQIIREKKQEYIKREREAMNVLSNTVGFVNLYCTFQDNKSLYFVMSYARNGDLLPYINKVGSFDEKCTQFYVAELIQLLEKMHKRGIIHRDLKPENILFDDNMHTIIADFGSAKLVTEDEMEHAIEYVQDDEDLQRKRANSFVGTAQYVSPEVLRGLPVSHAADLWALGCMIYQMISGLPPFRGNTEYLIFQKILNMELQFPNGFNETAKDLVQKLLKLDPRKRLGATDLNNIYTSIRAHPFFEGIDWDTLRTQTPPSICPYLPNCFDDSNDILNRYRVPDHLEPGLGDRQLSRLLGLDLGTAMPAALMMHEPTSILNIPEYERLERLEEQQKTNKWHQFVDGEVILKQGFVNKRKGLFARKRMLLLTTGPRMVYVDPVQMVKKGEIPWSADLRVEPRNFKIFFVHTPNRTYYLEDPNGYAPEWCRIIEDVRDSTYEQQS